MTSLYESGCALAWRYGIQNNPAMKLMSYNILEGGTGRIDPIAEVIRLADADVVALQETWDEALFHKLADRLGMDRFLAANPKNPEGSVGLLTRLRIREATNHAPLEPTLSKSAFSARIESGAQAISFIGLHLHHYETFADEAQRIEELDTILKISMTMPEPTLLAGDFNASHPQQQINLAQARRKTRDRIAPQNNVFPREAIGRVLSSGYADAHALHRAPADFQTSFTTSKPAMRVDYIFVPTPLAQRIKSCDVFKPEIARYASDHYPVVAEFL
jgi:exodeoxyribonuclease-3